jgi:hypothetical protein
MRIASRAHGERVSRCRRDSGLKSIGANWVAPIPAEPLDGLLALVRKCPKMLLCATARNLAAGNPEPPGRAAKANWEVRLLGWRPMAANHSDLELVVRHVAEERRIVARQRELIARLRAAGASTSGAKETLKAFEANLAIFEERERDLRQKG